MPVFIEDGDPDAWRALAAVRIGDDDTRPSLHHPAGATVRIPVHLGGFFADTRQITLSLDAPQGWIVSPQQTLSLAPGENRRTELLFVIPENTPAGGTLPLTVTARVSGLAQPVVLPVDLTIIDPSRLGNLLQNPTLEPSPANPAKALGWSSSADALLTPAAADPDPVPGLGENIFVFDNILSTWGYFSQTVTLPDATSPLLYTLWARTGAGAGAGSNVTWKRADGSTISTLNINQVFSAPANSPWRLLSTRLDPPDEAVSVSVTPVTNGPAAFANPVLSIHDGADWAAVARPAAGVSVDGSLDDWSLRDPIPLLAAGQLASSAPGYAPSPANLSAAAWLAWDNAGLYLAARVRDDHHHPLDTDAQLTQGDSLVLALQPAGRATGPAADARAFALVLSAAPPAGGGGASHILYRPAEYSGGLSSGHLARDSSNCDIAIARDDTAGVTTYELFLPWSELGGILPAVGGKTGLALQLNDNDGDGLAASMSWGAGLPPGWNPALFGLLTLLPDADGSLPPDDGGTGGGSGTGGGPGTGPGGGGPGAIAPRAGPPRGDTYNFQALVGSVSSSRLTDFRIYVPAAIDVPRLRGVVLLLHGDLADWRVFAQEHAFQECARALGLALIGVG
ncbi:MAG: hypothetical protein LBC18_01330, partial [Opitutaceae bacterium]|nr:hypothetical protein [Opitutaceae bacterium]